MKNLSIEQKIIAARPDDFKTNDRFVRATSLAVRKAAKAQSVQTAFEQKISWRERLFTQLKTLPTASLIALIIAGLIITSGAVYAAVHFLPDWIKINSKTETDRGRTEYYVPEFESCQGIQYQGVTMFELKKDAPKLTDEEVTKILQARCELALIDKMVSDAWPTSGPKTEEVANAPIYYGRAEILVSFENIENGYANVIYPHNIEGESDKMAMQLQENQKLKAYNKGKEINLNDIKSGDAVFVIRLIRDIPTPKGQAQMAKPYSPDGLFEPPYESQPLGVIGLIKLSLPIEYYTEMQDYLAEVPECFGNAGESCPNTGGADVFPVGSEGASNPEFQSSRDNISRQISGKVIELQADSLTLISSLGKKYTVTTPENNFDIYNKKYAKFHTDFDAELKVGSSVSIDYQQVPGADPQTITSSQIQKIYLMIDFINIKNGGTVKQY